MFSKKINSLKYFFDFTGSNTENINIEITSPNFENNFYPDSSYVEYKIVSSKFDKINIRTEHFNIDSLGDMVYLLHHKSDTMKLIKTNQTFETNDNDVSVFFRTDCSVNVGRFKILVNFSQDNDQVTTQSPVINTETPQTYTTYSHTNTVLNVSLCSSVPVVLGGSGNIYSPNYPDHYPKNSNCKWLLKAEDGKRFKISIKIHNVVTRFDYVALYNSSKTSNETLIAYMKGVNKTIELVPGSPEVLIVFVSDGNEDFYKFNESFRIRYDETLETPTKTPKSWEKSSGKGIIFPTNYNITYGFNEFNWTLSSNENKIYKLKVYIGNVHGYRHNLGIFDGGQRIAGLTSIDRLIEYVFYTDSNEVGISYKFDSNCAWGCFNYSSFYIEFEEVDKETKPEEEKQTSTCDDFQITTGLTENSYRLSSPALRRTKVDKAYGSNLNCSWMISQTPTPGKRAWVSVYSYGIGKNDNLTIYSGDYSSNVFLHERSNTYPLYVRSFIYTGLYSGTWSHLITFESDHKNSGAGFYVDFIMR